MSHNTYAMYENVVNGIAPLDTITTAVSTQWIDLKAAHSIAFLAYFGVITATSADQACDFILGKGAFAEREKPVTAVAAMATSDGFELAAKDARVS